MSTFAERIGRAIKLDKAVYEEIEHDKEGLGQAMAVVALSSVAAGIGAAPQLGLQGLFWVLLAAFIGWVFWAAIVYFVGTQLLKTPGTMTDMGELLRVLGLASAPGFFRIFGVFTPIQSVVFFVTGIWMLVTMIIAVRQALDFLSTMRAVAVCVLGWLLQIGIIIALVKIAELFSTSQSVVIT